MIKGDNLGDTNKPYLTPHEARSLYFQGSAGPLNGAEGRELSREKE